MTVCAEMSSVDRTLLLCEPVYYQRSGEELEDICLCFYFLHFPVTAREHSGIKVMSLLLWESLQMEKRDKIAAADAESGGFTKNKVRCVDA